MGFPAKRPSKFQNFHCLLFHVVVTCFKSGLHPKRCQSYCLTIKLLFSRSSDGLIYVSYLEISFAGAFKPKPYGHMLMLGKMLRLPRMT